MNIIGVISKILVSNELKGISQVIAIIGGLFVFYQWQHNNRLKKADYINELTEKIRTDEMIKETIYMFDYDEDWYLLPIYIDELLQAGRVSVKVLDTNDKWFGVTYKEDKDYVVKSFARLIEDGVYQKNLFEDLK